jgi:AP-4 complex subunit sigma-1
LWKKWIYGTGTHFASVWRKRRTNSTKTLREMAIKFVMMVNKQGQTRLASYYGWVPVKERVALEAEIIRRCLSRTEYQCSFLDYRGYRIIYRRYASLFFVVAVDGGDDENELAILEFIHSLVESLDKYFDSVCELDIMYSIDKAHYIVDEMVANGHIVENNKHNLLKPIVLLDKAIKDGESSFGVFGRGK